MKTLFLFIALITGTIAAAGQDTLDNFPNVKLPHEFNKMKGIGNKAQSSFKKKGDKMQGVMYLVESATEYHIYYNSEYLSQHTYTYDLAGNMLSELLESIQSGQKRFNYKYSFSYNTNGKMISQTFEYWDSVLWNQGERYTYTYDSFGNLNTELWEYFRDGLWTNVRRFNNSYDTIGNLLIQTAEDWKNAQWELSYRNTYSYNLNNSILTKLYEEYDNGQWNNYSHLTNTYDINGKWIIEFYEDWKEGHWINRSQYSYAYSTSGNLESELYEYWQDTIFIKNYLTTYTYGYNNKLVYRLIEKWNQDKWVNFEQTCLSNDANGNFTTGLSYDWQDGQWIESLSGYYLVNNGDGNILHLYGSKLEVNWSSITSVNDNNNNIESISAYPNPFSNKATIKYYLSDPANVRLNIYNALGNKILNIPDKYQEIGEHLEIFKGENYPAGMYYYTIQIGGKTESGKLLLVK